MSRRNSPSSTAARKKGGGPAYPLKHQSGRKAHEDPAKWAPAEAALPPESVRWKRFFWCLPLLYLIFYGRFGMGPLDTGFITGLSWRVVLGEIPHRDFIYIRPAMSCYLHALPIILLPESLELITDRLMTYYMAAASCFFIFAAYNRVRPLSEYGVGLYSAATLAFAFSVHNFPIMPWHTVDAIFLCAAGMYLLTRSRHPVVPLAATLLFVAGALCKQSFYMMPAVGLALAFIIQGWRAAAISAATLAGSGLLLLAALKMTGAYAPFMTQTREVTTGGVLWWVGWHVYVTWWYFVPAVLLLALVAARKVLPAKPVRAGGAFVFCAIAAAGIADYLMRVLAPAQGAEHFPRSMLWLGLCGLLVGFRYRAPESWILAGGLALAWGSSISQGHPSPELASAPLVLGLCAAFGQYALVPHRVMRWAFYVAAPAALLIFAYANQFPYCSHPTWKCAYNPGELFPRLSHLRVDKPTYDMVKEFKGLAAKWGPSQTLPSMPYSSYIAGTRPPLPVDWAMDIEIANRPQDVVKVLNEKRPYIFALKGWGESTPRVGGFNSTVTWFIKNRWKKVDDGPNFEVYEPPGRH